MRAAQWSPAPINGHPRPEQKPGTGGGKRPGGGRRTREGPSPGHPWLRWVPVPLAVLAAAIGALVMGSFQGQVAAANANRPGYQAGGLSLSVDTMLWMSNDMTGQGPANKGPANFSMPPSMMPGMQAAGENRLRVEVSLSNVTGDTQRYSIGDFSLTGHGGKTWSADSVGRSDAASSANLQPGFGTTIDVYFDVPAKQSRNLTLEWSRGGTTVSIPVHTSGSPGPMRM
jgi:Domain of unknown function (DUF4352)